MAVGSAMAVHYDAMSSPYPATSFLEYTIQVAPWYQNSSDPDYWRLPRMQWLSSSRKVRMCHDRLTKCENKTGKADTPSSQQSTRGRSFELIITSGRVPIYRIVNRKFLWEHSARQVMQWALWKRVHSDHRSRVNRSTNLEITQARVTYDWSGHFDKFSL